MFLESKNYLPHTPMPLTLAALQSFAPTLPPESFSRRCESSRENRAALSADKPTPPPALTHFQKCRLVCPPRTRIPTFAPAALSTIRRRANASRFACLLPTQKHSPQSPRSQSIYAIFSKGNCCLNEPSSRLSTASNLQTPAALSIKETAKV